MQEIVAKTCRNAFATIIMYAVSIYISKGGFILPFPVYEVLFFILVCYLFIKAAQNKIDFSFFVFLLILSICWMFSSLISLQLILPHQWLDSMISYFPIIDVIIVILFSLVTFLKFKTCLVKYKSVYFLFAFLIITKWVMLILS
jgi:hypothetical protein